MQVAGFGEDRNYLGHLRGAAVYGGLVRPGTMYLMCSDAINGLELSVSDNGYIEVTAEPAADDMALCTLTLTWRYRVTVKQGPCKVLRYQTD